MSFIQSYKTISNEKDYDSFLVCNVVYDGIL